MLTTGFFGLMRLGELAFPDDRIGRKSYNATLPRCPHLNTSSYCQGTKQTDSLKETR